MLFTNLQFAIEMKSIWIMYSVVWVIQLNTWCQLITLRSLSENDQHYRSVILYSRIDIVYQHKGVWRVDYLINECRLDIFNVWRFTPNLIHCVIEVHSKTISGLKIHCDIYIISTMYSICRKKIQSVYFQIEYICSIRNCKTLTRNCDVISVSLDTLVFISSYSTCLMIPVTKRKHFPSPDCKMILFCWLRWHTGMHKTQTCVSGPHFWMNHPKPYVKGTCFTVFCLGLLPVNLIHYLPNYLTATGVIVRMHSVRMIVKQPWCITVAS